MLLEINKRHVIALALLIFSLIATIWLFIAMLTQITISIAAINPIDSSIIGLLAWSLLTAALIGIITGIVFVLIGMRKK
ncbi:MAG: hypothetical protein EAX96_20625 [Candidatus Lokiarchaeota archaeon]|nr:hypothetical protein [Candidatus Lokiarchaeota archaeon]